jgi:hypothetical protein
LIHKSWRHALACACRLLCGAADLVRYLRLRSIEVGFDLLGDNLANMLRNRLHNLVRNVGVT